MKQQLKDYAHLYIGCQIELNESRFTEHQEDRIFTLEGVAGNRFCVAELGNYWYEMDHYKNGESHDKLVLRPTTHITTAERMERGTHILKFDSRYLEAEYNKWMINKGFDMFGLIAAGLAIDKTKLPAK